MSKNINTVMKSQNNMVMVFDAEGEQMPEYQGRYLDVKDRVLKDAPPEASFFNWHGCSEEPVIAAREDW